MVSAKDVQRLFLQAILSRRCLSQKMAKLLWKKSIDAVKAANDSLDIQYSPSNEAWIAFLNTLNDSMDKLDLQIVTLHDETTGIPMYAFVNRKGDDLAQVASDYSPAELAYFKALVDMIMTAPNDSFCISSLGALRELGSLKTNMTKTQGEIVLNSFVARGWLLKSREGKYTLSTRTALELQIYLRSTYVDEILDCTICLEMMTRGIRCYTPNCKAMMHHHCYKNYRRGGRTTCSNCGKPWSDDGPQVKPIGEAAYRDGQEQNRSRAQRRASDEEDETDEDEDDDDGGPSQPTQARSQAQSRKGKAKKPAPREDTDEEEDAEGEMDDSPPPRTQPKRKSRR